MFGRRDLKKVILVPQKLHKNVPNNEILLKIEQMGPDLILIYIIQLCSKGTSALLFFFWTILILPI